MYCFVDESGNTGNHLFDETQPRLYYGVLSCKKNLDMVAEPMLRRLRAELGVDRIHAQKLGVGRLTPVVRAFQRFQKKQDVRFDFFFVEKEDHAVISFFDQVFDSGMNDAVDYAHYFTPLRYPLLFKVSYLFDRDLAERAWKARVNQNKDECAAELVAICGELRMRLHWLPDARSREIIDAALVWTIKKPHEIRYGASNRESALMISPNLVGFQSVLYGIVNRAKKWRRPVRNIVVDRQTEFNAAQMEINEIYRLVRNQKTPLGPGMPVMDLKGLPDQDLDIRPGDESAGLEMVDVYLWIMKRMLDGKRLSRECERLIISRIRHIHFDQVSLNGIHERWQYLTELPEPDSKGMAFAKMVRNRGDEARSTALAGLDDT